MKNININPKNIKETILGILKKSLFICLALLITHSFIGCRKDNSDGNRPNPIEKKDETASQDLKKFLLITCPNPDPSAAFIKYNRLSIYLKRSTDFKIELFMPKDYKEFKRKVKNQEVDFLFVDPVVYLEVENFVNKNYLYALVSSPDDKLKGRPCETACIIAKADSNIKTIKDVKGKRVLFGSQKSATKWIAARKLFMDNGIDIEKDLAGYSFGNKCKDIVLDIFYQKADVGFVKTSVCPICNNSIFYKKCGLDTAELLHIAQTAPVNTWLFTCTNRIDDKNMAKIAAALMKISKLDLQQKERLSRNLRYGFVKVDDSCFDELRKIMD